MKTRPTRDLDGIEPNASEAEAIGLLSLASIRGVGFHTLSKLSEAGYQFSDVLAVEKTEEAAELLRRFGAKLEVSTQSEWRDVLKRIRERGLRVYRDLAMQGVSVLTRRHPAFPVMLMSLKTPPHWLFVQGNVDVLKLPSISVVGTRKPSRQGIWLTDFVGLCLHDWRCPTVSGLALGIDQAIHAASIEAGVPTIAVLGTGINSDYPKNAQDMRREIVSNGGALITEYLPGDTYSGQNFVQRNRIQAALGRALIPVEWSPKSGTAHTIRFATELKRPIALLNMPSWPSNQVILTQDLKDAKAGLFNIPGEEKEFRIFIEKSLLAPPAAVSAGVENPQPSLLDGL